MADISDLPVPSKAGPEDLPAPPPKSSFGQAATDVAYRGIVAPTIGAPVDITAQAMKSAQELAKTTRKVTPPEFRMAEKPMPAVPEKPVGGSEYIGQKMQEAGIVSPTRRPALEFLAGVTPALVTGGAALGQKLMKEGRKAKEFYELSKGMKADELANLLRSKLSGKAEEVIGKAESAQKVPAAKMEAAAKAQQELGRREPVATARQTEREKAVTTALDDLSKRKDVLPEDVGGVIQSQGQKNIKSLSTTREREAITNLKDPAFSTARTREKAGDYISTNPKSQQAFGNVIEELNTQIQRTPEPYRSELKRRFESVVGKEVPLTKEELAAEKVRSAILNQPGRTTKREPLTLDQAEFLRRMLSDRKTYEVEGFTALDVSRMNDLSKKLRAAMEAYEPRIGQYIKKYEELSAPITKARAGRGEALTDVELMSPQEVMFSADKSAATSYFLNGSEERAKRLLDLVGGKNAELTDAIKANFRKQVESMNAGQVENFIGKQEGLLRVFPELRDSLNKIVEAKRKAETMGVTAEKRAAQAATRLAGEATTAQTATEKAKALEDTYRQFKTKLESLSPKDSVTEAKSLVDKLRKENYIADDAYGKFLQEIEMIKQQYKDTAEAKTAVDTFVKRTLWQVFGYGTLAGAGYYLYKEK